jgi:hypothetical protein
VPSNMADRVECDKGLVMMGSTNRANERTPLANAGMTWRRINIRVKDNGPGCVIMYVGVILIGQRRGDT